MVYNDNSLYLGRNHCFFSMHEYKWQTREEQRGICHCQIISECIFQVCYSLKHILLVFLLVFQYWKYCVCVCLCVTTKL